MDSYTENTCIANPDYGQQSEDREGSNTETYLKAWNLNLSRNSSCFFLKGVIATCETHLDLEINSEVLYNKPQEPQQLLKTFNNDSYLFRRTIEVFAKPFITVFTIIILLNHYLNTSAIQTEESADFPNCLEELIIFIS